MSILPEEQIKKDALNAVASKMIVAARTAPKGRGVDNLECILIDGADIEKVAVKMEEIGSRPNTPAAFARDAQNIRNASVLVVLGTRISSLGLSYCGLCGYKNCVEKDKAPDKPCAFNTGDLGIAVGSAVSVAMDCRVDNRIMYTVGMAVKELEIMSPGVKIIYGIPLCATSKNLFFDRK